TNYGEVEVQYRETNTSTWTTHTTVPYDFTTIDIENLSDEEEYTVRLQTQTEHTTGSWTDLVSTGTLTPTGPISGTVENQNGQAIENATVKVFTVTNATEGVTDPASGIDELTDLSDPMPDSFAEQSDSDFQLLGDGGTLTNTDRPYALIYEESKFTAQGIYDDPPDLSDPKWRQIEQGETVAIAVGDPTATGFFYQDDFDRQVPGSLIGEDEQASVIIQEVLPSGENGSARVGKNIQLTNKNNDLFDATRQRYATLDTSTLTPGFYRITAYIDGERGYSYIVRIGSPYELINRYTENAEGQTSQLANQTQTYIDQGKIVVKSTTTNENGEFAVDVHDDTKAVQIQAYRSNVDTGNLANLTLEDLATIDGSLYFPSQPTRVTPPKSDIRLTMTEVSAAPGANVTELQQQIEKWKQRAEDNRQTFGNTPETVQDVAEKSYDELLEIRDRLAGIVSENEQAEQYYCQNYPGCEGNTTAFEEIDNKSRLNQQITGLGEALEYAAQNTNSSTVDEDLKDTPTEVFELIELPYIPDSLENIEVTATFEDGSTETIGEDALTVQNDTLVVNDWQVPEDKTLEDIGVDYPDQDVTENPDPNEDLGKTLSGKWELSEDLSQYQDIHVEDIYFQVQYRANGFDQYSTANNSEYINVNVSGDTVAIEELPLKDDAEFVRVTQWVVEWSDGYKSQLDATRVDEPDTIEETANILDKTWDVGIDVPHRSEFDVYAQFKDGTETRIPIDKITKDGQNVTVWNYSSPQNKEFDGVRFDWPSDINSGNDTEEDVPESDVDQGLNRTYEIPYNVSE
ncbi:hypothetical protein G9C84_16415, partial [Halolamina sp. R1-12]